MNTINASICNTFDYLKRVSPVMTSSKFENIKILYNGMLTVPWNLWFPTFLRGSTGVRKKTLMYAVSKNGFKKDRWGPILYWNENGDLVVHGHTIPGSHIVYLLKHTVSTFSMKEPTGYHQFYEALQDMHTLNWCMVEHESGRGWYVKGKVGKGQPGQKQFRWIPYWSVLQ